MSMLQSGRIVLIAVLAGMCGFDAQAGEPTVDFVRDVRPILQRHCDSCHGAKSQKSGLRLDIKSEAFAGGDLYGPVVVAGNAEASPLIQFVADEEADLRMPPEGEGLSANEIATLMTWVSEGAVWPDGVDLAKLEDRRDHWSFDPVTAPPVPRQANDAWAINPIDGFILRRLQDEGLQPTPEVDRVSWLRRVSLDLTGLPPSPEQVASFLNDDRPDAFERVVAALLNSPRYGERWAQHWLDVVRYADTHGFEVNTERPHAWPYRDYVIDAFNDDTPYDRFIREQLVGDALGKDAATGFLVTASVLLPGQIGKDEPSKRLARQDSLDEIVTNIGQTFLGLTVGCARCHDHKFDAISQRDYYEMQAFVSGVEYADRPLPSPEPDVRQAGEESNEASDSLAKKEPLESNQDGATHERLVFAGAFRTPDKIHLLVRGNPEQPKDEVAPAVLDALGKLELPTDAAEQQRRKALADWIASPTNPLTARVMVNRIWQGHFGTGLVPTANDFGRSGTPPSHPRLLDWLATEFMRSGWSIKHMHRLIVLSATYRQSTRHDANAATKDADVRLLWRFPSRRLEAEAIRDSMLAVSGRLDRKMGGSGFDLFDKRGGLSGFQPVESFSGDGLRRMIYAHKVRRERDAVFGAFDCPDNGQSTSRRRESTTPIQALNLFNSRFTLEEAEAFAGRIRADVGDDLRRQIDRAYQLAFCRSPDDEETADAEPVVKEYGLSTLCRVLFNSNEFLFLP